MTITPLILFRGYYTAVITKEPRFDEGEGGIPIFDLDFFEGYDATHHIGDRVANDNINLEDNYGGTV
jgi:hypothetical protein